MGSGDAKKTRTRKTSKRKLKAIDLFCGMGGMSLGMKWAGIEPVAAVDIWPAAIETYSKNFPKVDATVGDITDPEFRKRFVKKWKGETDLVVGGPPCQDFSNMAHKTGNDIPRKFAEFACLLDPTTIIMEQVPMIQKVQDGKFLRRVVDMFEKHGYLVYYKKLNAADYGVPQRRSRLFVIASKTIKGPTFPESLEVSVSLRAIDYLKPSEDKEVGKDVLEKIKMKKEGTLTSFRMSYEIMDTDQPAPTLTSQFMYPSGWRVYVVNGKYYRLGVDDGLRLHTFPEDYKINGTYKAAIMVANAVPPRLAHAVISANVTS